MARKIAVVFYSTYGHQQKMAEAEAKGVREGGYEVDLFRIPETLPQEILDKMYAPPKDASIPEIKDASTLQAYDGVLMGVPTRFGNMPAQWKTFWDATGPQWQQGAFWGKYAGLFITTGGPGEGQESTALAMMSTLAHHGFIYVPLGYKTTFAQQADIAEVRGGGPWGAGSFAAADGSRQPTELELSMAVEQGRAFAQHLSRVKFE